MIPELLIVALDFYRDPHRFAQLTNPDQLLPAGMTELLAAPGDSLSEENIEATANDLHRTVDECQQAVPFFVRRALLESGGDFYRILGLPRNADLSLIKRHYHYLIRLFHPDRDIRVDKWDDYYAPLINEAYSTLRNAQKRKKYDAQLEPKSGLEWGHSTAGAAVLRQRPAEAVPPQPETAPQSVGGEPAGIPPHAKKLALGLLVVVIVGFASLVAYQARKPTLRVDGGAGEVLAVIERVPSRVAVGDGRVDSVVRAAGGEFVAKTGEPEPSIEEMIRLKVTQAEQEVLGLSRQEVKQASEPVFERITVLSAANESIAAPVVAAVAPTPVITPAALEAVVASLVSSYERGDLDAFVGLFAPEAITTNATGEQAIYALYQQFFARPESREMKITDFSWRDTFGETTSGSGDLLVISRPASGGDVSRASGELILRVRQYPSGLKITGMYYKTTQQ